MDQGDVYFSVDVETDGPIPGDYSMLSFALVVAGRQHGDRFDGVRREGETFYRELRPISLHWREEALSVTGLDRTQLLEQGSDPADATAAAADWVQKLAGGLRPVMVGFPLIFDWMFLTWYFDHFLGESPFGFSSGLDIKSMYVAKSGVVLGNAGKDDLPPYLTSGQKHTHNALDDAIEQAAIFRRVRAWGGRDAASQTSPSG